jgi:RNA polymerase subunit RPABC4/transcription elongation factor Spt4
VSDLIESIKQGANQVLSSIDQQGHLKSAIEGLRSQWSEVDRRRRVSQLSTQLKALQTEKKQLTEALGLQTLSLYDAGKIDHPELARVCERLKELGSEIDQAKAELASLKAEMGTNPSLCPRCQAQVTPGADFCPKCGTKIREKSQTSASATPTTKAVVRLRCPKCKTILPDGAGFCPTCGVKLKMPQATSAPQRFCAACGAEIKATARFCPVCGLAAETRS